MALSIILKSVRHWFAGTFVGRIFGIQKEQEGDRTSEEHIPVELPNNLHHELAAALQSLNPHPSLYRAILDALEDALHRWKHHSEAPNSLVILGSPSDDLNAFVHLHLNEWLSQNLPDRSENSGEDQVDRPLQAYTRMLLCPDWQSRPTDYQQIGHQFQSALQQLALSPDALAHSAESEGISTPHGSVVLVPLLDWCFLRCVDGFDGIEQLQNKILGDRTRFWILGCNTWAWQYLDQVCQVSAYLQQKFVLPPLSSHAIKEWLAPVMDRVHLEIVSEESNGGKQLQLQLEGPDTDSDNWFSSQEQYCFERLASRSRGLSSVAADLWLRSLSVMPEDESSSEPGDKKSNSAGKNADSREFQSSSAPPQSPQLRGDRDHADDHHEKSRHPSEQPRLMQDSPSLPTLPSLTTGDRYILYSILLHGHISIPHLSLSLGDERSRIQAQVQALLRAGIINRHEDLVRVDPSYYLSIRADLERNNFLIGEPS